MIFKKIRQGSKWSRHSFGEVVTPPVTSDDPVYIRNEAGLQWSIGFDLFEREFTIADVFDTEKKCPRTDIVEVILTHPYIAMTVCFRKKPDNATLAKGILGCTSVATIKKILDNAGEERIMIGRHTSSMNEHGRLEFFDMEAQQMKQIDPRTISWAIVKGVKYTVKS